MHITYEGSVEPDARFQAYSHRLLRALNVAAPVRKAVVTLERSTPEGRYELEVKIYLSARATAVKHTAPNVHAAMDICYYDLRKRLIKRRSQKRSQQKRTLVQRVAGRIRRK